MPLNNEVDVVNYGGEDNDIKDSYTRDSIANTEATSTASRAYSVGDLLYLESTRQLYEVTADIALGGTITVGTNVVQKKVADVVKENSNGISAIVNVYGSKNIARPYPNIAISTVSDTTVNIESIANCLTVIAEMKDGVTYKITKKSGVGNRFRVAVFNDLTSNGTQIVKDESLTSYEYTNSGNYKYLVYTVSVSETLSVDSIEPMIRDARIEDDTYVPFAKTNKQLTDDIVAVPAIPAILNVYGSKNLFKHDVAPRTQSGITITVDPDTKQVKLNGMASETTYIVLNSSSRDWYSKNYFEIGKQYIFSCENIPSNTGITFIFADSNNTTIQATAINGGDVLFTVPNGAEKFTCYWTIPQNVSFSNFVLSPMIRDARIEDDTYVPYVPTNRELMSWKGNGRVGAKNLLPYPYKDTTKTSSGITFTDVGDGTIILNGDIATEAYFELFSSTDALPLSSTGLKPGKRYILTGTKDAFTIAGIYIIFLNSSSQNVLQISLWESSIEFTIPAEAVSMFGFIYVVANCSNNSVKPMIRIAEDTDDTYQPYAMTNKELTEKKVPVVYGNPYAYGSFTDFCDSLLGQIEPQKLYVISFNGTNVSHPFGGGFISKIDNNNVVAFRISAVASTESLVGLHFKNNGTWTSQTLTTIP